MISLISSGLAFNTIDMMMVLIQTDLPDPVAPAMIQWGHFGQVAHHIIAIDRFA